MKNLIYLGIIMLITVSCSKDTFRVIKHSNASNQESMYYNFQSTDQEYFVMKLNHIYYVKSDETIHYKKTKTSKRENGYETIWVVDDCNKQFVVNVYYNEASPVDDLVFIKIIDPTIEKEMYSLVLDWQTRTRGVPINDDNILAGVK
ncbi:MAG: hypothetical protein KAH25_01650 [Bacteroidales bacterium]|nr:hypothetical protein [Bacteroidales bacterium]